MSISLMSAVFVAQLPDVDIPLGKETHTIKASTSKFVLLALADHANDDGKGAYPSIDRLATKTSLTRRTVQRALDALEKLGLIRCIGSSEYGTNDYTINAAAVSRYKGGDSGTGGVTLVPERGDSGTRKSVPESPESSFKPSINQTTTTVAIASQTFQAYEREIGPLTPRIRDAIGDWLDTPNFPLEYIGDAIGEAARQNKRNWAYVEAILKRWQVEGKQVRVKLPSGPRYPNKVSSEEKLKQDLESIRRGVERAMGNG